MREAQNSKFKIQNSKLLSLIPILVNDRFGFKTTIRPAMVAASELMLSIAGRIVYALSVDFREAFAPFYFLS